MLMKLKRVGVLSVAKIEGLIGIVVGLIAGVISTVIGAAFGSWVFGAASIIWLPLLYGAVGFVGGAIGALLYNLIAGWIGGLEFEFEHHG